jgi:undecaprenyl-diphosphatase
MSWYIILLLSLIEGLTEFLPVSSTGHLILASYLFGISEEGFIKSFNIIIQFGAISSVIWLYKDQFKWNQMFYKKLLVAFFPAAAIGFLVKKKIDLILGSPVIVSIALILGGFILIWIDKYIEKNANKIKTQSHQEMTLKQSFLIGLFQCLAFIPGVSRSGSSIVTAVLLGVDKKTAAEFSFFLAVPTLAAAGLYKSFSILPTLDQTHLLHLFAGCLLSFVFASMALKFFIKLVTKIGFKHFGYYRIIVGTFILLLIFKGN